MLKKLLIPVMIFGFITTAMARPDRPADYITYFNFDSNVMTADAANTIDHLAKNVGLVGCARVLVVGHACELGENDYNMQLSHGRVDALRERLVSAGFAPSNIVTKWVGEEKPIAHALPKNRAVEVYLLPRKSWYRDFRCRQLLRNPEYHDLYVAEFGAKYKI